MEPKNSGFKSLDNNASFLLDLDGHKAVALKLPSGVAKEIAGQTVASGILAGIKSVLGRASAAQWLILTSPLNPLLQDYDRFSTLVAQKLTIGVGVEVQAKNLLLSGGTPLVKSQPQAAQSMGA